MKDCIGNVECKIAIAGLGIGMWNFAAKKKELGMELEYGKFHEELYSHSGIQGGFPTLAASHPLRWHTRKSSTIIPNSHIHAPAVKLVSAS